MAGDWKRAAAEVLLKLYKDHPILYDMRHPRYYNKSERQKALNTIIDMLEDHRPETTVNDILRKIQTMRTQFGQELGKVKKAQSKGAVYKPTVWWYNYLSFLRFHIKQRTSGPEEKEEEESGDYSLSITQNSDGDYENYGTEEAYEMENDSQSEIVYEIQSTPSGKGSKTDFPSEPKISRKRELVQPTPLNGVPTKGNSAIIYEITNANTLVPKRSKIEVISPDDLTTQLPHSECINVDETASPGGSLKRTDMYEIPVEPDRARSLGQFVSSQIASIRDDYLFYSTQMDVLNIINKAQLKQLQIDKEANK